MPTASLFRVGYVALTGAAPLLAADELGASARQGLRVSLSEESTWAVVRDKLALGALDGAHLQDRAMRIHAGLGTTATVITHDVDEAVLLSDRIAMLTNGPNARVGEILEADLPRPYDRWAPAAAPRFVSARASVLEVLHHSHTALGLVAA